MPRLYLLRHGQTEYNLARIVQGHCDSPLTERGRAQARAAAAWLREHQVAPVLLAASPLGRVQQTLDVLVEEVPSLASVPRVADERLIERCYGTFEGGPMADLPIDPWDPGDGCVPYGGDSESSARERIDTCLRELMERAAGGDVLAVSHGSISRLFKRIWQDNARCPQDVRLGNCCVMVYEYDPGTRSFANIEIVNHEDV